VSFRKGDFQGLDALLAQKESGLRRRLECFALETPLSVYGGEAIIANGQVIGMSTSGDFGHTVGRSLVLGYVPREYFGQNTFEIEAFGERSIATRVEGCIYDPRNERVRA
jgi:glycine cleavage system aminomethyltransferase T